jgi:hypothetical protein
MLEQVREKKGSPRSASRAIREKSDIEFRRSSKSYRRRPISATRKG